MNNELIFTLNSCLYYISSNIFEDEKKYLLNQSFKDYIISRKCQENNLKVQTLKKEEKGIGQFLRLYLVYTNDKTHIDKRPTSSKAGLKKKLIQDRNQSYSTNDSTLNKSVQSLNKIKVQNDVNERNQTPKNIVNPKINLNNIIKQKTIILSTIQEESNKVPRNINPKSQNKDNNT